MRLEARGGGCRITIILALAGFICLVIPGWRLAYLLGLTAFFAKRGANMDDTIRSWIEDVRDVLIDCDGFESAGDLRELIAETQVALTRILREEAPYVCGEVVR